MNPLNCKLKDLMEVCLKQPQTYNSAYTWYYQFYEGKWYAEFLTGGCMSNWPLFFWVPDDIVNPFERFKYVVTQIEKL